MQCPKCGGEAYLVEEELVKVVENTDPMKVIAKAVYQCRSCAERFSRLVIENIDARKKEEKRQQGVYSGETVSPPERAQPDPSRGNLMDQLRFF